MSTTTATFGQRLRAATQQHGPLCAGIDPHRALLESWGLAYDLDGLRAFADACVDAFGGHVGVVKPQSAFFEVFGSGGVAILESVIHGLQEAGTLVLLDAKRGDIGSTMEAYATAYLGDSAVAPGDALTVSPYLGFESLRPALDTAAAHGRGVFVLALTSNPEGASVQHARAGEVSVAEAMVRGAAAENAEAAVAGDLGSVGLVVGATVGDAVRDLGIDLAAVNGPLLAPGVGAQGGNADSLRRVFGDALPNVLPASSREVLSAGPDVAALRARAHETNESLAALLS
ncbi:orotidine-5'-phosphate decarboxylase [Knoellia subterranea]|uniref:Orotidine 5'-phosphate decarboxylase n=1 Tax=Knoellia subterranea KCTC 19937 TaxID=1385521 RepID=A0A0A0JN22_9MICO|nr:orotidine-5'-phosphate decarboxylase [Knoellia subterranea]KGN38850.1 orotidine 5'-phosphate decarboxylase [Knoellia subterranea KCTC 19937]